VVEKLDFMLTTPYHFIMSAEPSSSATADAHASVIFPSEEIPADAVHIKGPDFSNPIDLNALLESYATIGFQATGLSQAMYIVEEMVRPTRDPYVIAKNQRKLRELSEEPLTLFLGYTSNLISSGLREILVDCIVTTAGGIEEDFIKCLGQTILGDFAMDGAGLRKRG
jgi:deoxyhypusine synthase